MGHKIWSKKKYGFIELKNVYVLLQIKRWIADNRCTKLSEGFKEIPKEN